MKQALAIFLVVLMASCGAPPAEPPSPSIIQWSPGRDAPQALFEAQGVAAGGRLYVFGGFYTRPGFATTVEAHAYDPVTNAWTRLADVPRRLTHAGNAVVGESIYLAGGFVDYGPSTAEVWIYDISTDSWRAGPPLPERRGGGALVALDGKLHYFGGTLHEEGRYHEDFGDHWILDLGGDGGWIGAAPLPNPRNHLGGAALDGKIYAIGGQHLGDEGGGNQRDVHAYDPATDTWTAVARLPYPLSHITPSIFIWDGRLVVVGGVTQGRRELTNVIAYDPASDTWSTIGNLPEPRQTAVVGLIGDAVVVTTGWSEAIHATTWLGRRQP